MNSNNSNNDIDVVITYVDGSDPEWIKEYEKYVVTPPSNARFRSWDTVKYLLRGIDDCMPWVRNIYLVVMSESQVPAYIDTSKVKIVYHKDFIPIDILPVFNSNPIELYLWNIEGLSEYFIYFNDDMIPMRPLQPDDFFEENSNKARCKTRIEWNFEVKNVFHQIKKNSTDLAYKASGIEEPSPSIMLSPRHGPNPMLKSYCKECFKAVESEIIDGLTKIRSGSNATQYLFTNYMYLKGMTDEGEKPMSFKYDDFGLYNIDQVVWHILYPDEKLYCLNDTNDIKSTEMYEEYKNLADAAFEKYYPNKSKYEL